jgi:hypothetical protein
MDLHDQLEKLPLLRGVRLTAGLGPGPQIVVTPIRHQNLAQPLDREPIPQAVNECEPLARRSQVDQRRRSLVQNLVLDPQPLELPTKPPHFGVEVSINGHKLTVINSTGHDKQPCRTEESREHAVAKSCSADVPLTIRLYDQTCTPTAMRAKSVFTPVPTPRQYAPPTYLTCTPSPAAWTSTKRPFTRP